MGVAYLRYADDRSDLNQALSYLHEGNAARRDPGSAPSPALVDEALVALLLDQKDKALDSMAIYDVLRSANSPYTLTFSKPSSDQFLSEFDIVLFRRLWIKFSKSNFDDDACHLFQDAFVAEITVGIPDLQSAKGREQFLDQAIKKYKQLIESRAAGDYAAIRASIGLPEPSTDRVNAANRYVDRLISSRLQLDVNNINASIYVARHFADTSEIYVRFYTDGSGTRAFCQGRTPDSKTDDFWVFHKDGVSDADWRLNPVLTPEQ